MPDVEVGRLRDCAERKLVDAGATAEQARAIVDHLLTADLWGRSTHGVAVRLPVMLRLAEQGAGARRPEIVSDRGSAVHVDANDGFGYVAGAFCTDVLIERVRAHGLASVALSNATHTGMMGYYLERAARAQIVTLAFADCCPLMAPFGGARKLLGTNPASFGFPFEPDPIICDMATSAISYGDLLVAQQRGEEIPDGCALDAEGRFTRDAGAAIEGALVPFGAHKGGALAVAVQLLSGVLTGSAAVPRPGHEYGLLLIGLAKGVFVGDEVYDRMVGEFAEAYDAVPPMAGHRVRLPGVRRFEMQRIAREGKLCIPDETAALLGV